MGKISNIVPIFYVRGYNPPYNEGHIVVVRGMVRALLLQDIRSLVLNYKYTIGFQNNKYNQKNGEDAGMKFEQNIPYIDRETLFHQNIKSKIVYASLMETLALPSFLSVERCMSRYGNGIINIINCFRYPRIFAKKFSPLPVVLHIYTRKFPMKNTIKMIINKSDMVITSSISLASHLEKNYDIDKLKIQTVYPPLDTDFYHSLDKRKSRQNLGLKESAKILLYIGNLRKLRFPEDRILRLMKRLVKRDPNIELVVFSPRNQENIRRAIEILTKISVLNLRQNIKINVTNLSEVEKRIAYSAADIFLFLPLESGESIEPPLAMLEAMSCGLPIISSNVTTINEIIRNEVNGLIWPFIDKDLAILEEQIFSLLRDDKAKRKFSTNSRRIVSEKMALHNVSKNLLESFTNLLG